MSRRRFLVFACSMVLSLPIAGCDGDKGPERPRNDPPSACFVSFPDSATTDTDVQFDASCSSDDDRFAASLRVRWDWDGDGAWDTEADTTRTATRRFDTAGNHVVRLEAIDEDGATSSAAETLIVFPAPPPAIRVTSPNGLDDWELGTTHEIRWSSIGRHGPKVKITLLNDGGWCKDIALDAENTGVYRWDPVERCGDSIDGYKIRIRDLATGASDTSDFDFRIPHGRCTMRVISPNGGEVWRQGEYRHITWERSEGCGSWVSIRLRSSSGQERVIAGRVENSGVFAWSPVEPLDSEHESHRIFVIDLESGEYDQSDSTFLIRRPPCDPLSLTLISPVGGETWTEGTPAEIQWTSTGGCGQGIKITLLHGGVWCKDIAFSVPNTGSYIWESVEQCGSFTGGYTIRIRDTGSSLFDESDLPLTIRFGTCDMVVTEPADGTEWVEGDGAWIRWTRSMECAPTVRIELLRNGEPCRLIRSDAYNGGSFRWYPVVPCADSSGTYTIRLVDPETGDAASSQGSLTIREKPCVYRVTKPVTLDSWPRGSSQQIQWTSRASCREPVDISLLRNGLWCRDIAVGVENSGSYQWNPVEGCDDFVSGYQIQVQGETSGATARSGNFSTGPVTDELLLVEPGSFVMGSPTDERGRDEDETQHSVTLTRLFYICRHEVTQAEWEAVLGWNDSRFPGPNRAMDGVTWFDAILYCNERSTREGAAPAYTITDPVYDGHHVIAATVTWNPDASGYRLPTEGEWEYACRAGSRWAFCNGPLNDLACDDVFLNEVGWYCGNGGNRQPMEVNQLSPNAWGIHDMHGNVSEWCWDLYGPYDGPATDPAGPSSGTKGIVRGGSGNTDARGCRSAERVAVDRANPAESDMFVGFRVVRSAVR